MGMGQLVMVMQSQSLMVGLSSTLFLGMPLPARIVINLPKVAEWLQLEILMNMTTRPTQNSMPHFQPLNSVSKGFLQEQQF